MTRSLATILSIALLGAFAVSGATVALEDPTETVVSAVDVDPGPGAPAATTIKPDATVVGPRPHAWDHIVVGGDGRTLAIYFWMGIEECNGLHSVAVTPAGIGIIVELMTGIPADMAPGTACIEIARLYVTTVTLDQALIGQSVG